MAETELRVLSRFNKFILLVGDDGVEPSTSSLSVTRSNHLSPDAAVGIPISPAGEHRDYSIPGGRTWIRTRDLYIISVTL